MSKQGQLPGMAHPTAREVPFDDSPERRGRGARRKPYNGEPPFVAESSTSKAAADEMKPTAGTLRSRVLEYVLKHGDATDDEIEQGLDLRHQTASARRRELVLGGQLVDTGRRRQTRSGRSATVWAPAERKKG